MTETFKVVTVECLKSGGTMDVRETSAQRLIATGRWKRLEPPVVAEPLTPTPEPATATADAGVEAFGEDLED